MAQLLFESVPVLSKVSTPDSKENPTVVTVHPMLDQQLIVQYETAPVLDENDVFQCGRCKKQFSTIESFVNHKTECNNSINQISDITLPSNVCRLPQNAVVQKIQIPSSMTNYHQSVILTETDILRLSAARLDSDISSTAINNSSIQINPSHTLVHQTSPDAQCGPAHVRQVLHSISSADEVQQPHAVELSILNDKLLSRPLILTSQQPGSTIQSLVLNIGTSSEPQTIICSNPGAENNCPAIVQSTSKVDQTNDFNPENASEKEPSTVNIITEFHSSMVKTKKLSPEAVVDNLKLRKDSKLSCAYCSKSFTKNFDLQQHIRSHTGEKPFQCIVCGRAFAQKSNVKKHMQTHKVWPDGLAKTLPPLPVEGYPPPPDFSQDSSSLDAPADENADLSEAAKPAELAKNSYACPYCTYISKTYVKFKSHMKQHDNEKVYKCIVASCGLMFNDLDPFLEHTRSHENEMTYRCHQCNLSFESLVILGSHQVTHRSDSMEKSQTLKLCFQCNLCLNKYSTPEALNHHLATSSHTYSCTVCEKVFPCERYLRRHLQIHSDEESHKCNVCGKGFKTETYLKVHMLCHSGEKPYECATCKAAFNRKDKLKRHLLIHEPVKRHKCPFQIFGCSKEFSRPDKLKSHILTHGCAKSLNNKSGKVSACRNNPRSQNRQSCNEDSKSLDEAEMSERNSSGESERPLRNKKCLQKKKRINGKCRLRKPRKAVQNKKMKPRTKDLIKARDIGKENLKIDDKIKDLFKLSEIEDSCKDQDIESDLGDDIPTAHIEIISVNSLANSSDLTHLSLGSDINYDMQFDSHVAETDVSNTVDPITVEIIDSSNSNPLLTDDLHSTQDVNDFS